MKASSVNHMNYRHWSGEKRLCGKKKKKIKKLTLKSQLLSPKKLYQLIYLQIDYQLPSGNN